MKWSKREMESLFHMFKKHQFNRSSFKMIKSGDRKGYSRINSDDFLFTQDVIAFAGERRSVDSVWCELERINSVRQYNNTHFAGFGKPGTKKDKFYRKLFQTFGYD